MHPLQIKRMYSGPFVPLGYRGFLLRLFQIFQMAGKEPGQGGFIREAAEKWGKKPLKTRLFSIFT